MNLVLVYGVKETKKWVTNLTGGMKRVREDVKGWMCLIWILKDRLEIGESRGKAPYTGEIAKMRVVSENTWSILGMPSG